MSLTQNYLNSTTRIKEIVVVNGFLSRLVSYKVNRAFAIKKLRMEK
jgi:hypothetical protein